MTHLVIVGAGPSGLAAAYEATRHAAQVSILERLDRVGGLARTVERDGNRYDIGPHRFFTHNTEVRDLFVDVLGDDVVRVPRRTRILYGRTFFDYPLTPVNAMFGLGFANGAAILGSYAAARMRALAGRPAAKSFEDSIVDRFGRRLYRMFFKSYTEKVWGVPCERIGADWATQRIKGLDLASALRHALLGSRGKIKTLADEFMYPRLGAGQLYDKLAAAAVGKGAQITLGATVVGVERTRDRIERVRVRVDDEVREIAGDFFLCSAPLTELLEIMHPPPPPDVLAACRSLRYRNHIGVKLAVRGVPFRDNWIYVHSPDVRMARISNYRNFSAAMAGGGDVSPLTVEYFCSPGDSVWEMSEGDLVAMATRELAALGVTSPESVLGAFVVRSEHAYPVIEMGYEAHIACIRRWLATIPNLLPIGRSGMFKYNNQDHAIATGLLAARTALGLGRYDPWNVNIDGEYHESGAA
jgi:protoporphyrinogen oxidase